MKKAEIKKKASKLQLNRETLRALEEPRLLRDAVGGQGPTASVCGRPNPCYPQ